MFSSSAPVYLDHPNWHQLQQQDHQQGCGSQNYQLQPTGPPPPPPQLGGGGTTIKPISMVDRARIAKVLQPEAGLKCPRCESSNTKFCYFNNYNLSQPRHFCKTCRRYWTRGGSLRNIPVGGGCRKNKRSKSKSSKHNQVINTSASTTPSRCSTETPNHFPTLSPIMDSLHNFGGGNMGIGGFQSKIEVEGGGGGETSLGFQSGSSSFLSVGGAEQWRLPFLTDLGPLAKFFQFQSHEGVEARSGNSITQLAPVKMEENLLGLNLSREFMGVSENTDQFWVGNQWREI